MRPDGNPTEHGTDERRHDLGCPAVAGAPDFCTCDGAWELWLGERVVADYDTREDAEVAKDWYVRTFGHPTQELVVKESGNA